MNIDVVLCMAAWAGVILIGAGVIGVIGAMFWAFDPRRIEERGE